MSKLTFKLTFLTFLLLLIGILTGCGGYDSNSSCLKPPKVETKKFIGYGSNGRIIVLEKTSFSLSAVYVIQGREVFRIEVFKQTKYLTIITIKVRTTGETYYCNYCKPEKIIKLLEGDTLSSYSYYWGEKDSPILVFDGNDFIFIDNAIPSTGWQRIE